MSDLGFVVNDRRGQKKEVPVPPPVAVAVEAPRDGNDTWEEVTYVCAFAQGVDHQGNPSGLIMIGRAVGLRSDEKPFVADYLIPPTVAFDFQWQPLSKKRLDTFLNCDCKEHAPCTFHRDNIPQWQRQDAERIGRVSNAPVPRAIEVLMRAEQARAQQSRIVAPGRG